MKRFLLATAALAALSAPAAAADLATKYPVKAIAAPVFSWTGFYIGANAGYGGDKFSYNEYTAYSLINTRSINSSGFFVGGQLGYNYQFANNVVVGLETDIQWSNISGTVSDTSPFFYQSFGSTIDYFGTIRARLGYAFDRFLPYITGGAAYGRTSTDISGGLCGAFLSCSIASTNWGWTLGGGVEYAITNNWTFKTEYLYVDLGNNDVVGANWGLGDSINVDSKFHTVKAGVNYKF
ncbi:outer membrane protein [Xanthobacter sediminis]|uniref:outer membrane protein n=1 Tax=Xanthobacter sediminis TaxID=3119926 RepID=UPI0037294E35